MMEINDNQLSHFLVKKPNIVCLQHLQFRGFLTFSLTYVMINLIFLFLDSCIKKLFLYIVLYLHLGKIGFETFMPTKLFELITFNSKQAKGNSDGHLSHKTVKLI